MITTTAIHAISTRPILRSGRSEEQSGLARPSNKICLTGEG
jgi:hypothetical protein